MNTESAARLLSLLLAIPVASGAREAFELASFEPPSGWERLELPGQLTFRAPAGDGQISLFASFETSAAPRDIFVAEWARLVAAPLGVATPSPTIETSPGGWTAALGAANVAVQDQDLAIVQVTTTGFGRAMSIVVVFAAGEQQGVVTRFLDGVEFTAGEQVPATAATAGPAASTTVVAIESARVSDGKPVGLFYHLRAGTFSGARLELETRIFFAGNRVTRMYPFGGGDSFDTGRCIPDSCGSYELSPGKLTVQWDNGRIDRWSLAITSEGIELDSTLFRPAREVAAASLVGEWTEAPAPGTTSANFYRFGSDGTFEFGSGAAALHGRYSVQALTLGLRFDDGDERRRTLIAASPGEPAVFIDIEGDIYSRR